jgi:hypothetical protein
MEKRRVVYVSSNAWTIKNLPLSAVLFVYVIVNIPVLSSSVPALSSATIPVNEITTREILFN